MTITCTRGSSAPIPGRDGADWLSGQGAPAASLGPFRSRYLDELNGDVYAKSREGWSLVTNIGGKSPILAVVSDDARRVLKVTGWVGSGATPPVDVYVGAGETYVLSIASAVDIRGPQGVPGGAGEFLTGTAAPGIGLGSDGAIYFRTDADGNALSWQQKAAGAWGTAHDMRGPAPGLVAAGRTITGADDLEVGDLGTAIIFDSGSNATITLPDSLGQWFWCMMIQKGIGKPIFAGGGTATLVHPYGHDRIGVQYGSVTLMTWLSATQWSILGETAAA